MDLTTCRNLLPLILLYGAFFAAVRMTGIWPSQSIRNSVALIIVYVFALLIGKVFVPSGKVADK